MPFGTPFFNVALFAPQWADGTLALLVSIVLINLLVLLEVADRLSLKGELEVAREIQLAMLPTGTYSAGDADICGVTRPANTVGGDFYDVLPLADDPEGRVIVTIGDVAGKGSPAALLMALLLAVLRTLVDEKLEARALVARLNRQICRHSPGSRFITLFYGVYTPSTGALTYVNAGQNPPLLRRADGSIERLGGTGIALGMFESSTYEAATTAVNHGDLLVLYSDGITEAENPAGQPFEESGLERFLAARGADTPGCAGPGDSPGHRSARPRLAIHGRSDGPDPQKNVVRHLFGHSLIARSRAAGSPFRCLIIETSPDGCTAPGLRDVLPAALDGGCAAACSAGRARRHHAPDPRARARRRRRRSRCHPRADRCLESAPRHCRSSSRA